MPTHRTSSPSPSSHKRASEDQSLDSHSNRSYSDSFDSDESDTETATIKSQGRNGRQTSGKRRSMKQQKSIYGKKWRGGGGGSTRTKASGGHDTKMDAVAQRMKSARRKNTNALKNALEVAQQEAAEMHNENKTLKRQMHLSEKVLDKYVAAENDMGSIMSRHTEAMRSLKEQVRKHKDKASKATQKLKATEEDLDKTQRMLKKMKGLVDDSELDERDKLARKLHKYEDKLEASEKRVSDLDKYKDNLQKNNRHEIGIERARFKDTKRQLDVITSEMERLKTQLREKEKEIDVHNIYSMRLMKPPHRLNSVNSSPMASRASYVRQRKNSDPPSSCPTPHGGVLERNRLRALRLEEEEEEANNRELQRQQREREEEDATRKRAQEDERLRKEREELEIQNRSERERERREQERKEKENEDRRRKQLDEERLNAQRDAQKRESERLRVERVREEEKQCQEDNARRAREDEEEKRRQQERDRREAEVIEHRAEQERNRIENDDKDRERQLQKKLLLAKMKEIDGGEANSASSPSHSSRKEYKFTDPVENMHRGKPSHEIIVPITQKRRRSKKSFLDSDDDLDLTGSSTNKLTLSSSNSKTTVPRSGGKSKPLAKSDDDDFDLGGYKPTFMSNTKGASKPSKDNLMDSLFGGDGEVGKQPSKGGGPATKHSSHQLFAGGSALVNDLDDESPPTTNMHLLPRRTKQPTATLSKPSVNAIDDDLEELVL